MIGRIYSTCRHHAPVPPQIAASAWPSCSSIAAATEGRDGSRRAAGSGGMPRRPARRWYSGISGSNTSRSTAGSSTRTAPPRSRRSPISLTLAAITSPAAEQDRPGDAVVDQGLRGAQHRARPRLPRSTMRLGSRVRRLEHRPHQVAGAEHEPLQVALVGGEIRDRTARDAAVHRRPGDGGGDLQDQAGIERLGDDVVRAEHRGGAAIGRGDHLAGLDPGELGDRLDGGDLHLLVDRGGPDVQRAAENEREAQDVVDLVGIVAAAGGDDGVRAGRRRPGRGRSPGPGWPAPGSAACRPAAAAIPASARAGRTGP